MPKTVKISAEPVEKFGDWEIMPDGEIRNHRRRLTIHPERLKESDWWLNLRSRAWMASEWNDFIPAWFYACQTAGINEIPHFKLNFL